MAIIHRLGIDVVTRDAKKLIEVLGKLKSTRKVHFAGAYAQDDTYSQVLISTELDEGRLDTWLHSTAHGVEYVGVFTQPSPIELVAV